MRQRRSGCSPSSTSPAWPRLTCVNCPVANASGSQSPPRSFKAQGGAVVASLHDINLAWDLATHAVLLDGSAKAHAGRRDEVMSAPLLAAAFGVAVDQVEVCGQTRFWVGPLRKDSM